MIDCGDQPRKAAILQADKDLCVLILSRDTRIKKRNTHTHIQDRPVRRAADAPGLRVE